MDRHLRVADPAEVCGTCWRFTEPPTTRDRAAIHSNLNWTILSVTWSARRERFLAEMDAVIPCARLIALICWSTAHAQRCTPSSDDGPLAAWAARLKLRRGINVAAVALANKNARVLWALLTRGRFPPAPARPTLGDAGGFATIGD